ncbi:MAG: hypothetical protein DHS20C18_16270 [Saprospiraceae bacterium]|nr:MAG: hypothetical protein DHS20C18_16270 [Saprospiraceae bacterium]
MNGNKFLAIILVSCLWSLSSCELFRKAQGDKDITETGETLDPISGKKVYDPQTGTYVIVEEAPSEKVDTILWKEIPTSSYPPITSDGVDLGGTINPSDVIRTDNIGSQFLSSYNISLLLPFLTDRFSPTAPSIYENSQWALNFYSGAKIALDLLSTEDVKINLSVIDTKASPNVMAGLLRNNNDLISANLIIGPYRSENVSQVANAIRTKDQVLVSPHSASSGISPQNPNYIQVNPTLKTHSEAIMRHALTHFRAEQIVMVSRARDPERSRLMYFYDEYKKISGSKDTSKIQELIISDETASLENIEVLPFIDLGDTTVFIVPSWSETFVYSLLRKIDISKDPYDQIYVYGMPQWMQFEKIDYSYYEKLNVRISTSTFADPLSSKIQLFQRQFFERYGSTPTEEAYLGYDIMLYFGRMLKKHGTKFQYSLERDPQDMLLTRFDFERVVVPTTTGAEFAPIQNFENKFVNILKFQDYQFQVDN